MGSKRKIAVIRDYVLFNDFYGLLASGSMDERCNVSEWITEPERDPTKPKPNRIKLKRGPFATRNVLMLFIRRRTLGTEQALKILNSVRADNIVARVAFAVSILNSSASDVFWENLNEEFGQYLGALSFGHRGLLEQQFNCVWGSQVVTKCRLFYKAAKLCGKGAQAKEQLVGAVFEALKLLRASMLVLKEAGATEDELNNG